MINQNRLNSLKLHLNQNHKSHIVISIVICKSLDLNLLSTDRGCFQPVIIHVTHFVFQLLNRIVVYSLDTKYNIYIYICA